MAPLAVTFTGLRFENPFLLSSAPPTESDSNIMRAFDAGWGGVVTKTIGLHPVVNVARAEDQVPARRRPTSPHLSMQKRPGTALHSSWNWELISDKPLDWWVPRIARIKQAHPDRDPGRVDHGRLGQRPASSRTGRRWPRRCQDEGADALELNLSCPHMDRKDMGSNIGKDTGADLDRHAGGEGSGAGAGLGQADAVDHRHRRRGARRLPRRRRRHRRRRTPSRRCR